MGDETLSEIQHNIINSDLAIKALINDILQCEGPMGVLNKLNELGRKQIADLRVYIDDLDLYADQLKDNTIKTAIKSQVKDHKEQLSSTLKAFQKANIQCVLSIEKRNKEELFHTVNRNEQLRRRQNRNNSTLLQQNESLTDHMLSVSRQLADTNEQSAATLEVLLKSSSDINNIHEELKSTGTFINQSGKLLDKYKQREFTDKILTIFAFTFFITCVLYVLYCRL